MPTVTRSATLPVPAARAWALIRDFNAMPAWNDTVHRSHIEDGPADRVGCLRVLQFDDGGVWTHRLSGLSDDDMRLQYRIVGTPQPMRIPVWDYQAEMQVQAAPPQAAGAGRDQCTVVWQARFETADEAQMLQRAAQVFDRGLQGLRDCLSRTAPP